MKTKQIFNCWSVSGTSMPSSDIPTTHPRPSPTTPASSSSRFSSVVQVVWVDQCEAVWYHCATVSKKKKKKVWYQCATVSGAFWMDGVHPAHCLASTHAGQLSTSLHFSAKAAGLTIYFLKPGHSCWQYGHCDRLGNSQWGWSWPPQRSSQGDILEKKTVAVSTTFLCQGGCACCKWRGLQSLLWSGRVR